MKVFSKAFTLAEVLLTLAVIGVVASLTIPAVITKVQQDQYVVGLKKAYNTLKAVEREAIQENGPVSGWDLTLENKESFDKYFKPHLDILKDCGTETDDGCFDNSYMGLDNSSNVINLNISGYYKIITSDGIAYAYSQVGSDIRYGIFYVDVNGKKKPNIMGRDLFVFNIFPEPLLLKPFGTHDGAGVMVKSDTIHIDLICSTASTGYACATKVLAEGAMNY